MSKQSGIFTYTLPENMKANEYNITEYSHQVTMINLWMLKQ